MAKQSNRNGDQGSNFEQALLELIEQYQGEQQLEQLFAQAAKAISNGSEQGVNDNPAIADNRAGAPDYAGIMAQMSNAYMDWMTRGCSYWGRMTESYGDYYQTFGRRLLRMYNPTNHLPTTARTPTVKPGPMLEYPVVIDEPLIADAYIDSIPLEDRHATLSNGQQMAVPFRFWRTQALALTGTADMDKISAILERHGETAVPDPGTGRAIVYLFAPNYGGSSAGPIPAMFASIRVQDNHFCGPEYSDDGTCLDGEFFWIYRSNNELNHLFKREVWGVPSKLAHLTFDFLGNAKAVAVLENGAISFRMVWANAQNHNTIIPIPGERRFTSVTPLPQQSYYLARFKGTMLSPGQDSYGQLKPGFPFDANVDELYLDDNSEFSTELRKVDYQPMYWNFYADYAGVVEIPAPEN